MGYNVETETEMERKYFAMDIEAEKIEKDCCGEKMCVVFVGNALVDFEMRQFANVGEWYAVWAYGKQLKIKVHGVDVL